MTSAIKCTISHLLRNKNNLVILNDAVVRAHDIVVLTLLFIKLYIIDCYENNRLDFVPKQQFIMNCMNVISQKQKSGRPSTHVDELTTLDLFYEHYFLPLLPVHHVKPFRTNIIQSLQMYAKQLQTNYNTNIRTNYFNRLWKFIQYTTTPIMNQNNKVDEKATKQMNNQLYSYILSQVVIDTSENEVPNVRRKPIKHCPEQCIEWCRLHLRNVVPDRITNNFEYDMKSQTIKYFKFSLYMNRELEKFVDADNNNNIRLFRVCSLRTENIPKSIPMDTQSLIELFGGPQFIEEEKLDEEDIPFINQHSKDELKKLAKQKENQHKIMIFKVDDKKVKVFHKYKNKTNGNYLSFNYSIRTDAVSVSLLFGKGDSGNDERDAIDATQDISYFSDLVDEELNRLKDKHIVGVDPGKENIVYMTDEDGNCVQYTRRQRRQESRSRKRNLQMMKLKSKTLVDPDPDVIDRKENLFDDDPERKAALLNTTIQEIESMQYITNSKSTTFNSFQLYIAMKVYTSYKTKSFYTHSRFRRHRFDIKLGCQKSEHLLMRRIAKVFGEEYLVDRHLRGKVKKKKAYDISDLCIAYGDYSFAQGMKNGAPVPGKSLRKKIQMLIPDTYFVFEGYTSQRCHRCHNEIKKWKGIHRVQYCDNCFDHEEQGSHTRVFLSRDWNSASNMCYLANEWVQNRLRPASYRRPNEEDDVSEE